MFDKKENEKIERGMPKPSGPNKVVSGRPDQLKKIKGEWIVIDYWYEATVTRNVYGKYVRSKPTLVKRDIYKPEEKNFFKEVNVKIVRFVDPAYPTMPQIAQLETWKFKITPSVEFDNFWLRVIKDLPHRRLYKNHGVVVLYEKDGAVQPIFIQTRKTPYDKRMPEYSTKLVKTEKITLEEAKSLLFSGEALCFEGNSPMGLEAIKLKVEEEETL